MKLVGFLFIAAPVILALFMLLIWRTYRRVARSIRTVPTGWLTTQGVVVDEQRRYDSAIGPHPGDNGMVFVRTPIVRFTDAHGRDVVARSGVEGTFMPRPGASVSVHYDPTDPQRARVAGSSLPRMNRIGPLVVATIMVAIFLPLAAVFEFIGIVVVKA